MQNVLSEFHPVAQERSGFSRTWLESLSNNELLKLAEEIGIYIPSGLERIFIIEELLIESSNINENAGNDLVPDASYIEPVPLPKQYNISFVEVMIRDPLWVYVFWEIKSHDREIHENFNDFNGYCLRIYPLNGDEVIPSSKENSFEIAIDANDSARYVGFAEQSLQSSCRYIIKLGVIRGDSELQLAISQPFNLPRLIGNETICDYAENPLIRLSGALEFNTTKSSDRSSRIKERL